MALQIANSRVVSKVERLAKAIGLTKTAAVERAVDQLLNETLGKANASLTATVALNALLKQLDQVPDRPDAYEPLAWDEHGLQK